MLNHPDLLGAVAELHRNDMLREAERRSVARQVARQTSTTASERRTRFNGRQSFGATLVRFGRLVSGPSNRPPAQADSAGA